MQEFLKGKIVTGLIVIATVILAGVAIFTALRLYQLRRESISPTSPESQPQAWDCSKYTFALDANGVVTVTNNSAVTITYTIDNTNVYTNLNDATGTAADFTATAAISAGKTSNGVSDNESGVDSGATAVSRPHTTGITTN